MTQLHPAIENIIKSGRYVCRPKVEGFTEHELKDRNGKVVRKVTKQDLEEFARVGNSKAANGALSPIGPGHTFDDVYDDKGLLVRKFPEKDQPKPFGYLYNYRVELNPHTGKYSLFHDEWIQRTIIDPDTGKEVDGLQYSASFPRRSAEAYHNEHWIDWMAALRRAPRLDLALQSYASTNPHHTFYAMDGANQPMPACEMARGKTRYSFDTGAATMPDSAADPTKPPSAEPPKPDAHANAQPAGAEDLPPEHKEAAERYMRHTLGMHHTRAKKLLGHLHSRYAAECGMSGTDMMAPHEEYAMTPNSGSNAGPPPAAGAAPPTPAKPEPTRMQHDQAAIEKERYEQRLRTLEEGLQQERTARAAAEERALHTQYERELMQLVYEGYEGIDASKELEFCTSRKYSRQQFDDHVGILRRLPKAPIGDLPPIASIRDFKAPAGSAKADPNEKYAAHFDQIQRLIRNGMDEKDAYEKATGEKYPFNNGVAAVR